MSSIINKFNFSNKIIIVIAVIALNNLQFLQAENLNFPFKEKQFDMTIQKGHMRCINDVKYSQDGKYILTASDDATVKLWTSNGILVRTFGRQRDKVLFAGFSSNNEYILSSNINNETFIFEAKTGRLVKELKGFVRDISKDGNYFLCSSKNGDISMYNFKGEIIKIFQQGTNVDMLEKNIKLEEGEVTVFKKNNGEIARAKFSPNGKYIACLGWDNPVLSVWDIDGKKKFENNESYYYINFTENDKYIITSTLDGKTQIFDIQNKGNKRIVNTDKIKGWDYPIASSNDGNYLAVANGKKVYICNSYGETLCVLKKHKDFVGSINFSLDNKYIVTAENSDDAEDNYIIKLWTIKGKLIRTFDGHEYSIEKIMINPDNKYIVSFDIVGVMKIWSVEGKLLKTIKSGVQKINKVDISSDTNFVLSSSDDIGWDEEKVGFNLWNIDGKLNATINHFIGPVSANFTKDGKYVLSKGYKYLEVWDIYNKKVIKTMKEYFDFSVVFDSVNNYIIIDGLQNKKNKLIPIYILDFNWKIIKTIECDFYRIISLLLSDDSKYIVVVGTYDVNIFSTEDVINSIYPLIEKIQTGNSAISAINISHDNKYLATCNFDGTIKIWDLKGLFSSKNKLVKTFNIKNTFISSIAFTYDGKYIYGGDSNGNINIWNLDGNLIKVLNSDNSQINSILFTKDKNRFITGGNDGVIKIWNINDYSNVSFLCDGKDWLIYTDDGYFDASKNGGKLLSMTKGFDAFAIDQFALKYNRPDIILERLGVGTAEQISNYKEQYLKRLRRIGITEEQLLSDLHVPEAQILNTTQIDKFATIKFKLIDDKYNLKKYNIYVNDIPLFGAYGKNITGTSAELSEKIELTNGENKIEVSCINEKGAESYRALTIINYDKKVKSNLYYIGFGVSKYKDENLNLSYADKDAKDLAEVLKKMGKEYKNIHIKTYVNEEVTKENIKKAKEFLKDAKPDDTFVLFIAGHGLHDTDKETKYYYLTHDTDLKNLANTAADFDTIEDLLQGIAPRQKLFFMDTCESGEIEDDSSLEMLNAVGIKARSVKRGLKVVMNNKLNKPRTYLFEKDRYIYNDLLRRSGAIVFSSSLGGEYSYEDEKYQNGFFTKGIIEALTTNNADTNKDGIISTDELREYVSKKVAEISENKQHPTIDRDNIYCKFGFPKVTNK